MASPARAGLVCARGRSRRRGTLDAARCFDAGMTPSGGAPMHGIIYLVGLIVVIMAILSFFGLR
jgi:hypothetical protein